MLEASKIKVPTGENGRLVRCDDEGRLELAPSGTVAGDGVALPVDSLAQVLAYNANGTLSTITVTYLTHTYKQTYTYTSGKVTGISQWVKQ